jgi:hypothetical protein
MRGREARTLERTLRCRCPLFAEAVVAALVLLFTASTVHAQVSAGGDLPKGAARLEATLSAAAEVPGPGDPDLSGTADLVVNPRKGTVCFDVELDAASAGADTVVALHIHPSVAGAACTASQDCAPAIDLDFGDEGLEGCAKKLGKQLLSSIVDEPEQFYLHVHTARFPAGAARGQLETP